MCREVRKVPADWKHPQGGHYHDGTIRYVALFDGKVYPRDVADWDEECAKWNRGEFPDYADDGDKQLSYAAWSGERPTAEGYMPVWSADECTHFMMYETCSEGTPISPAFATREELARWLTDTGASAFSRQTASYEAWLEACGGAWAPSLVFDSKGLRSGIETLTDKKEES